jgi:hypothetical protein
MIKLIFIIIVTMLLLIEEFLTKRYDKLNVIEIQLDYMYENEDEMAYAVLDKLKKQGNRCKITELKEGHLTIFTVEEKKYKMMYKLDTTCYYPIQTIQLKICK